MPYSYFMITSTFSIRRGMFIIYVTLAWAVGITPPAAAGRIPESWDHLPQIREIHFSKTAVEFISFDGRYLVLERKSGEFQNLRESRFRAVFPGSVIPPVDGGKL